MYAALCMEKAMRAQDFRATGQTGILITGDAVPLGRLHAGHIAYHGARLLVAHDARYVDLDGLLLLAKCHSLRLLADGAVISITFGVSLMRQVYVNGDYLPEAEARVSIFDRGFLFADGVYEVTLVLEGKLVDFSGHMARLRRSLGELDMPFSLTEENLLDIHRELIERNEIGEGLVYLQVTRGAADRDFIFPTESTPNTVVLFTQKKTIVDSPSAARGQHVVTLDDLRWRRCDIKTVQLLYPSMAKMQAKAQGADDAWLVKDGFITEGSSSNAYIVTTDGTIVTRDLSIDILHGITREAVLICASDLQLRIEERPFTVEEIENAAEAFSTSASGLVNPVVKINGKPIGVGKPGSITAHLRQIYVERSRASAI